MKHLEFLWVGGGGLAKLHRDPGMMPLLTQAALCRVAGFVQPERDEHRCVLWGYFVLLRMYHEVRNEPTTLPAQTTPRKAVSVASKCCRPPASSVDASPHRVEVLDSIDQAEPDSDLCSTNKDCIATGCRRHCIGVPDNVDQGDLALDLCSTNKDCNDPCFSGSRRSHDRCGRAQSFHRTSMDPIRSPCLTQNYTGSEKRLPKLSPISP